MKFKDILNEFTGPGGGDQRNMRGSTKPIKRKEKFNNFVEVNWADDSSDRIKEANISAKKHKVKLDFKNGKLKIDGDKKNIKTFLNIQGWDKTDIKKWYPELS